MEVMVRSGKPLHELVGDLKVYPQTIKNVRVREKTPFADLPEVAGAIDAAEKELHGSGRVVVRYSGTEGLARVMVEAESEDTMKRITEGIAGQINLTMDRKGLVEVAYPMFRMRDQTLGIIGFGKIGTATALKATGLGMKVIAYDPYVLGAVMETHGVDPVDLETLLQESDFISLHTPLNRETRNLIGHEEFKKMKPTSYFINTARGGCVDQESLIRALREGRIAGAGIDVTVDEPIAATNPLIKMANVILTGHSAFYSVTSEFELYVKPMTQVVMALRGEWPTYAVNPEVKKKWMEKWGKKG